MNIKNIQQFDENSAYFAELSSKVEKARAAYDEKEAKARQKFEESIKHDVESLNKLETALLDFANDTKDEMFAAKKTYKNKFVSVSLRATTSFDFRHGYNVKKVADIIRSKFKFLAERFIVTKDSLNKSAINAAIKSKELNKDIINELGLETNHKESINLKIN